MNNRWKAEDAKARFSELLDACISRGPQIVTRQGIEIAAIVSYEQWCRMQERVRLNTMAANAPATPQSKIRHRAPRKRP